MDHSVFTGCGTALVTPFTEDGKKTDLNAFEKLIGFQLENLTDALIIAGTTGESPTLSPYEKTFLFRTAVSICKGRIPVIAGAGSNNTQECVVKCNDAEKEGVDGLLIVTPYYNKCTQDGVIRHYEYISDRVSVPIIVYNVPSRTGFDIAPETYKELSKIKNVKAVKEASSDITKMIRTRSLCGEALDIYSGNDDETAAMMTYGAKGVISVAANIVPDVMHHITKLLLNGECAEAAELQMQYEELFDELFIKVNPIPVKTALGLMGLCGEKVRLPLTQMKDNDKAAMKKLLEKYSIAFK